MKNTLQLLLLCGMIAVGGACNDSPSASKPPASVEPVTSTSLAATVGSTVELKVRVLDAGGKASKGITVEWGVNAGSLSSATSVTDAQGNASATWTLGTVAGEQVATAATSGFAPVMFRAAAAAGPVAQLTLSAVPDSLNPGQTLELTAAGRDQYGNSTSATVAFASSDTAVAQVDASGRLSTNWPGTTEIAATSGSARATVRVNVRGYTASIGAGGFHSCALARNGTVSCWGENSSGALGVGSSDLQSHPVAAQVVGGHRFASLSVGASHTCAVTPAGEAYCWGSNTDGQLGAPASEMCGAAANRYACSTSPLRVSGGLVFRSVSAGTFFSTCGVTLDGRVYCWGMNGNGQLGTGNTEGSATPVPVAGNLRFSSVDVGSAHACGIATDGTAYCWGSNGSGQLGTPPASVVPAPVAVASDLRFRQISAGELYTCGVTHGDRAYCWGTNAYGQLGNGTTRASSSPTEVVSGRAFSTVVAGINHTCATTPQGAGFCWGNNERGQLGAGISASATVSPVGVTGGHAFTAVALGRNHTCGMGTNWQAYCWGLNNSGQLGTGTMAFSNPVPAQVTGFVSR
jgi:alpha-tubulin suppressor-like RCC1 family protein